MKSKHIWELMINPFTRIAGWQAFGLGLVFVVLTGIIGTYGNIIFDGVLDMHTGGKMTLICSFIILGIDILSIVAVMSIVGMITSRNFRFIDILGTMTLARAPFLLLAIAGFFTVSPDLSQVTTNPYIIFCSPTFVMLICLAMPVVVWNITLLYNALKVSCDIKGSKLTVAFIIGIFVSEVISKLLIYIITKNL